MAEITRYKEQPIFQPQPVSSAAKGYDALAQVFGEIGSTIKEEGIKVLDEQSKVSLLQSRNAMNQTVIDAKIQMINSPDLAGEIQEKANQNIKAISQTAMVHDAHRSVLDSEASSYLDQVKVLSASAQRKQLINDTRYSIGVEFPKTMQTIDDLYKRGRVEDAHKLQDNLTHTAELALKIGAIDPKTYQNINMAIQQTTVRAQRVLDMLQTGDGTAQQYHAAVGTPYGDNNVDQSSMPANEYSTGNAMHYDEESTKEKALSDIYSYGHLTNQHQTDTLTEDAQKNIHTQWLGANDAKSHIQSGTNQIAIEQRYNDLKGKAELSLRERGELNYLKNYYKRLENGAFIDEIRKTTQGDRIHQQFLSNERTIQNSGKKPEEIAFDLHNNRTWEKQQYINLWNGLHGDPKYVRPMSREEVAPVQTAFVLGQDPSLAISKIRAMDSSMVPYMAESMKDGKERAVVSIIGQAGDSITQGLGADLIYANQEGYQPKMLDADKTVNTTKKIQGLIVADQSIHDAISYLNLMPHDPKSAKEKGGSAASSMIDALTNTAFFKMDRSGDYHLENINGAVTLVGMNVKKAYDIYTSSNIMFNRSTLKLEDQDLKSVGSYALAEAYSILKEQTPKARMVEFMDVLDRQPLMVVNTPNNYIAVINSTTKQLALDKNGQPLFFHPYTDSMMHASKENKQREDWEHYYKVLDYKKKHPFGNTFQ